MIETSHFHPMLVHFPIALVTFGYIAELGSIFIKKELFLSKISLFLLVFGTLSAVAAYLTGQLFTADMSGAAEEVRKWHETLALITMGLLLMTTAIRSYYCYKGDCEKFKWFTFCLYSIATISVSITGFLGGTLVYNYMMPL
ncbi:MAG: DUF2231 domain-containing protein [Prolixibacteraceae bacterium]|jgi:uncharacterized membrane protein|nr:DUF2231 domain-containing protein [Prolixibacteraceae bacterium]